MPILTPTADSTEYLVNLRRLFALRWTMLALMALTVVLAPPLLDVKLPQSAMLAILAIAAAMNLIGYRHAERQQSASAQELFSQLLIDIGTLSALVFLSGGATNPMVSLLLPPVAIAALALPRHLVLLVGLAAVLAYSLLMLFYLPLPISDVRRATQLHLIGMWLTFAVSAALIGWIILRMSQLIRERDAALAAIREQALRDEKVTAMGTLAAGAAHELGTPLATISLLAGELANDPALSDPVREDIRLIQQQISACKRIIGGLARRADNGSGEEIENQPCDQWLDALRLKWHALRPQTSSHLHIAGSSPAPSIATDPRLEQAVLNLLNNAANASPYALDIRLDWNPERVEISISDQGPGFPEAVLALSGRSELPAHAGGYGIGLMLTRTAIEQLGGRLELSNPPSGGALARILLPLEEKA